MAVTGRDVVPLLRVRVERGQLTPSAWAAVRHRVAAMPDGEIEIVVRLPREPRSYSQNRFWRAIVALVAEATGEDADRVHYSLLGRWGGWFWGRLGDRVALLPRVGHSAPLTKRQMGELLDWAVRTVPDPVDGLGVRIPDRPDMFDDGEDG